MDKRLYQDLIKTGFIHAPLELHEEKSVETRIKHKKVRNRRTLWNNGGPVTPEHSGLGAIETVECENEKVIRIKAPVTADRWPEGAAPDGEYSNYGSLCAHLKIDGENLEDFNRIAFRVKPECPGGRIVHLNMCVTNEGKIKVPDQYYREGCHVFNLKNHQWNECVWEFDKMARDKVTDVMFYAFLCGRDTATGDYVQYDLKDIELQYVDNPENELGWQCNKDQISYSTTGYWADGAKTAIANAEGDSFSIVSEDSSEVVYSGQVTYLEYAKASFKVLDFSELKKPGRYIIQMNDIQTDSFEIGDHIIENAVWKVINFLYCERCGHPVTGRHGTCHFDLIAEHNGLKLSFAGGWHDAGDVSQQMAQSAEITHALFEMANAVKDDTLLYTRLMEEAEWGLEFVLRTRFGDGFRATSAAATRWTDGKIGNMDDIIVRGHNHSFENFLCAGIEAYAAKSLNERDFDMAWKCAEVAKDDFNFALERFNKIGIELPNMYEHTYNSSLSLYYAVIVWSASNIYSATGEKFYAEQAGIFAGKLMACQDKGDAGLPIKGFFYRDESKKAIVHFSHQSREYAFIQALEVLCTTQPENKNRSLWEESMLLYGQYLKDLMKYPAPYGMLPAGIYSVEEAEDEETFKILHLNVKYEEERENYIEQVKKGVKIGENYYVKCFPVWFSFRGNTAVHLAMGKAATLLGKYFKDSELTQIGREQLYWMAGKNPFNQSMMYGEGSNYAQQYALLPGEMVGEMPVGIETYENDDIPYWPQNNNATYKEVWTSTASRWLWIAADLY